jgi:hypothetical protein
MCGCDESVASIAGEVESRCDVQVAGWFIGGRKQGGDQKKACECLAVGGGYSRMMTSAEQSKRSQEEERKSFSYPGSTGTLGATWIWLILLLAGLRRISECLPMTISQVKTHVASLTTWRRKSASRLCCGHL